MKLEDSIRIKYLLVHPKPIFSKYQSWLQGRVPLGRQGAILFKILETETWYARVFESYSNRNLHHARFILARSDQILQARARVIRQFCELDATRYQYIQYTNIALAKQFLSSLPYVIVDLQMYITHPIHREIIMPDLSHIQVWYNLQDFGFPVQSGVA